MGTQHFCFLKGLLNFFTIFAAKFRTEHLTFKVIKMKKQFLLALVLTMTAMASWGQTLNIGGHRAPLDTLNHIWLCSVPQSFFGDDFAATVTYGDDIIAGLTIDGVEVPSGGNFVFAAIEGGKQYAVTAQMGDSVFEGGITFTWLPVVELSGTFGKEYSQGYVTVSEPDSAFAEPMFAKLKWRGGTTNYDDRHKRNYHIKFLHEEDTTKDNHRFFGLRNDNSWILDAGQVDFLRVRNRINSDLWLDMARKPWYADSVSNVRNGSRGQMVEVLLNGEYVGIYNMCEPIDRKQLKLKRYELDSRNRAIIHGVLWKADGWSTTVNMSNPIGSPIITLWNGFEIKYPDYEEVRTYHWRSLTDAVWFANRADTQYAIRDSMGYYFDLPVMQDYYIFIVALQALDNECCNIYYGCYDFRTNSRLTMVPWDLDITLGQNYSPDVDLPDMVSPERYPARWISHVPMCDMLEMKWYYNEVLARYRELRQNQLNTDSLVNRFRTAITELELSGAAAREESRWSGDSDIAGKELNLSSEMDYVEDWIRRRMAYLDEYVFIDWIDGDVNGDGEINISDVNCLIGVILGQKEASEYYGRAYVNDDYEVNIADVNSVISKILGGN